MSLEPQRQEIIGKFFFFHLDDLLTRIPFKCCLSLASILFSTGRGRVLGINFIVQCWAQESIVIIQRSGHHSDVKNELQNWKIRMSYWIWKRMLVFENSRIYMPKLSSELRRLSVFILATTMLKLTSSIKCSWSSRIITLKKCSVIVLRHSSWLLDLLSDFTIGFWCFPRSTGNNYFHLTLFPSLWYR